VLQRPSWERGDRRGRRDGRATACRSGPVLFALYPPVNKKLYIFTEMKRKNFSTGTVRFLLMSFGNGFDEIIFRGVFVQCLGYTGYWFGRVIRLI
jgi:hypothetical protein